MNKLTSYIPFTLNNIKTSMAYRLSFFITILSRFFTVLVTYYLWKAIFQSSVTSTLGGFNFEEMTTYVIISFFTATMIGQSAAMEISWDIREGGIAMILIKPISYLGTKLAESVGSFIVKSLIHSAPFLIIFTLSGFIAHPNLSGFCLYLISVILAFLNMFLFGYIFGLFSFYTTYFFGLNMIRVAVVNFFSGILIPLSFLPETVESVFTFLPFASMNYIPIMIYLGKLSAVEILQALIVQMVWIGIFYLLGKLLWHFAIKRLTILGG